MRGPPPRRTPAPLVAAALLLATALAGCMASVEPPPAQGPGEPLALALDEPVRVLGMRTREPTIAELPDGTLFVAGFVGGGDRDPRGPLLWRSGDGGATWARADPQDPTALGNSDVDLAVGPDGTLYLASLTWTPWGHSVVMGASRDAGASWAWSPLMVAPFVDRPWVEVAPDGTAHAVWSSLQGLHHAASRDRGTTWQEGPIVHATGGSGGLAVGPGGELAVRVFPLRAPTTQGILLIDAEADGVAVSRDQGRTWAFRALPGERAYEGGGTPGDGTPRWAEPVAFDAAGTLYAAWGEGPLLRLARSADLGASWDVHDLPPAEEGVAFYPWLAAGAPGEVLATWFEGSPGEPVARLARLRGADGPEPRMQAAGIPMEEGTGTGGEYFQGILLRGGGFAAALPVAGATVQEGGFLFLRGS